MSEEPPIPLETLLRTLAPNALVVGPRAGIVSALTIDSRGVKPGSVFVALRGEHTDGHRFIAQAIDRGASAVVVEESIDVPAGVTAVVVADSARALSQLADAYFGAPSHDLTIAGVTGTNGKTTATQMLAAILNEANVPCGVIGTIGARFGDRDWELANTTPLPPELHGLLAQMRETGAKAVAMEVSSHAVALQRVADVRFHVGALTNVTRDHLDFHKTFEAYAAAKRSFFDLVPRCVFNADDELGLRWAQELAGRKPTATYALHAPADMRAEKVEIRADGSTFDLDGRRFDVRIPGRFNVSNALCAIGMARTLDVSDDAAARGLAALDRVAGRMEHVHGAGIDVVVDYAHTPDALENLLRALRETASNRLLTVFGCGGDRDRGKRPQMGAVAARYADFTYVTSDNPRTEDPQRIIADILPGIGGAPHAVEADRRKAIEEAVRSAQTGDVVAIAGKGHEAYQIVGQEALPFDDVAVAREALLAREGAAR